MRASPASQRASVPPVSWMYILYVWLEALHGIAGCDARLDTPAWGLWVRLLEPRAERPAASRRPSRRVQGRRWRRILPVCPPVVAVPIPRRYRGPILLSSFHAGHPWPGRRPLTTLPAPWAPGSRAQIALCQSTVLESGNGHRPQGQTSNRRPGQAREHMIMMCPVNRSISQPDESSDREVEGRAHQWRAGRWWCSYAGPRATGWASVCASAKAQGVWPAKNSRQRAS